MHSRNSVAAILLAASSAFAADPGLIRLVDPASKVVGGLNVDRAAASQFGQFLLREMKEEDKDFRNFVGGTGFDPRRDIREVVFASDGQTRKGEGLVLVRGVFNPQKIAAFAKSMGAATTNYKDVEVLAGTRDEKGWIAFLDGTTALAGSPEAVKQAIDRRSGGAPLEARLAAKVTEVGSKYDAWAVSLAPVSQLTDRVPDKRVNKTMSPELLQAIEQTSVGILFGPSIQFAGEAVARSDKDATALVDVIRFMTGLLQMNTNDNSELARAASLLDTLDLRAEGNTLKFSLSIPEEEIEKFIENAKPKARTRRVARR